MNLIEQHVAYDPVRFSRIGNREAMANYYGGRAEADMAAVLVAEIDDRIVGFAYLEFEPILYAELAVKVAWLYDIFVDKAERHEGVGQRLLDVIEREARSFGAQKVMLSVAAKNEIGFSFFERAGFRTTMYEMMLVLPEVQVELDD